MCDYCNGLLGILFIIWPFLHQSNFENICTMLLFFSSSTHSGCLFLILKSLVSKSITQGTSSLKLQFYWLQLYFQKTYCTLTALLCVLSSSLTFLTFQPFWSAIGKTLPKEHLHYCDESGRSSKGRGKLLQMTICSVIKKKKWLPVKMVTQVSMAWLFTQLHQIYN